jgi:hypothetical protein
VVRGGGDGDATQSRRTRANELDACSVAAAGCCCCCCWLLLLFLSHRHLRVQDNPQFEKMKQSVEVNIDDIKAQRAKEKDDEKARAGRDMS